MAEIRGKMDEAEKHVCEMLRMAISTGLRHGVTLRGNRLSVRWNDYTTSPDPGGDLVGVDMLILNVVTGDEEEERPETK
ncbi:MAG: hypothetical protein JSW58_08570 [Candidatus Latescibacterota bacterium]|nr:MAG: hypothetical protein JSW58_08570 [Candidatus Latescibacterota bacterium]